MYLLIQQGILSQYKALPSPIYGGDYYFQLGSINHIRYGGDFYKAPNYLGTEPGYFILYSSLVAVFANLLNMDSIHAVFLFSQVTVVLSLFVFYVFIYYLFRDKTLSLLGAIMYIPISRFPVLKYTDFTAVLMMPLFFLSVFYFFEKRDLKSTIFLGILYGLCGISHGSAFIVANIFIAVFFVYMTFLVYLNPSKGLVGENIKIKFNIDSKKLRDNLLPTVKLFTVIFIIGFSISLLYWYGPIFVYHGKTLNDMQNWAQRDFSSDFGRIYLQNTLQNYFLNFRDILSSVKSILSLIGVVFLIAISFGKIGSWNKKNEYIALLILTAFIAAFHYLISIPLIGTQFGAPKMVLFAFSIAIVLLALFSLDKIIYLLKIQNYREYIIVLLLILFIFLQHSDFYTRLEGDRWVKAGKSPLSPDFLEMQKWIVDNTEVNDVFLSSNELSFALNALTGRKLVISRRSHASPFVDIDQREADAAIILHGNDDEKKVELLKKYNVRYLYWNYYWVRSEYIIDSSGRIVSWFDPLLVKDSNDMRVYLEQYNISYVYQNTWIDPAMRSEWHRKLDLLFILPKYRSVSQTWVEDIDKYLEPVWEYNDPTSGQVIARIYRLNY